MLKSLILLAVLISALPASDIYRSNELMHKIARIEALTGDGWELDSEDTLSILYKDGIEHSRKEYFQDGYSYSSKDQSERIFLDEDGNLIRKVIKNGSIDEEYNYLYIDGVLAQYSFYDKDGSLSVVVYETTERGKLVALESNGEHYFGDDFYVYTLDGVSEKVSYVSEELSGVITQTEDGGYTREYDGIVYMFSPEGRLTRKEEATKIAIYSYDEGGSLTSESILEDGVETIKYYQDGSLTNTVVKEHGVIVSDTRPLPDGDFEEIRYLDGKKSYRIIYDRDGKRVKEIIKL